MKKYILISITVVMVCLNAFYVIQPTKNTASLTNLAYLNTALAYDHELTWYDCTLWGAFENWYNSAAYDCIMIEANIVDGEPSFGITYEGTGFSFGSNDSFNWNAECERCAENGTSVAHCSDCTNLCSDLS